jgi:hypothetical protein
MNLEEQVNKDLQKMDMKDESKTEEKPKDNLSSLKRKTYPIILEGNEYRLRFDLNALELIEREIGEISGGEDLSIFQTKIAIYAGLRVHHSELSKEHVGAMIGIDELEDISKQLESALKDAMQQRTKGKKAKSTKAGGK